MVHAINNVFHFLIKYAFTPSKTKLPPKTNHSSIPLMGRYFPPTYSDAIINIVTPTPALENPVINLDARKIQKLGENALMKPIIMWNEIEMKRVFKRPNL